MHIVILGNGISGITAARFLRKLSEYRITVISKESDYFYSRTALMYIYMGHMRQQDTQPYESWFWDKNSIDLVRGRINRIDFEAKTLFFDSDFSPSDSSLPPAPVSMNYDKLILALGSTPNMFGWPGQDLERVGGLYDLQDLETMERCSKDLDRAVIVGGGLIGIEMAEMFHSRGIPVTMLVREERYWDMVLPREEADMIGAHIRNAGIDLRTETELAEIHGNERGEAIAVTTNKGERIDCQFVGLTAGVHPNIQWLRDSALELDRGILVDNNLKTNVDDVYAIGDCAQMRSPSPGRRPVEAVWYTGRMMGETVAYNICGNEIAYEPGIWFNSAKFIHIEYQIYGNVPVKLTSNQDSLFWQHPDGEKSIRIVYDREAQHVLGFNLLGIRFRQEVCEKWIREQTYLPEVLTNLQMARFDPEFYPFYQKGLIEAYEERFDRRLSIPGKFSLNRVIRLLKPSS